MIVFFQKPTQNLKPRDLLEIYSISLNYAEYFRNFACGFSFIFRVLDGFETRPYLISSSLISGKILYQGLQITENNSSLKATLNTFKIELFDI